MAKKRKKALRKVPRKRSVTGRLPLIEKALKKRTKADLIKLVIEWATNNADFSRALETELKIQQPADVVIADIDAAIYRATDFDDRDLNHNFDYDYDAYEDVKRGLEKLIKLGQIEEAQTLALLLMKYGSYQVECSDEGMMTDDIEACLKPVIRAVKALGGDSARQWASTMLLKDSVGFICEKELKRLAGHT